jgi:hypothetical protein
MLCAWKGSVYKILIRKPERKRPAVGGRVIIKIESKEM